MPTLTVFGATGQIGRALQQTALPAGWDVQALDRRAADLSRPTTVERALDARPDTVAVVNAAAYTDVDRAETEAELAFAVNAAAPGVLAAACARHGVPFVQLSTDYVFDGRRRPGGWQEDDRPTPLNVYGRSKAAGERSALAAGGRVTVLRTSWVFSPFGHNFVRTMLRLAATRPVVRVVADQTGRPTAAATVAAAVVRLVATQVADRDAPAGILHVADIGATTWYGFAEAIFERVAARTGWRPRVVPISSTAYPTTAPRPLWSVLDTSRLEQSYDFVAPSWHESLDHCVDALLPQSDARRPTAPRL